MRGRSALLVLAVVGSMALVAQAGANPGKYDGTYRLNAPKFPGKIVGKCSNGKGTSIPIPARAMTIHVRNDKLNGQKIDKYGDITRISHSAVPIDGVSVTVSVMTKWAFGFNAGDLMSYSMHMMGKATGKDGTCSITGSLLQTGRRIGP